MKEAIKTIVTLFVASLAVGLAFRWTLQQPPTIIQQQPCRCGTVETGTVEYSVGGGDAQ